MNEYGSEITFGLNAEAITERMNDLHLTTADLGDLLGSLLGRKGGAFSPWTVSTWLAGKSLPDGLTLCAIAHLLDLSGSGVISRKLTPKERRAKELRAELDELDAARVRLLREMDSTS
jgi:hypothetical protein